MKKIKQVFQNARSKVAATGAAVVAGAGSLATQAMASVDVAGVNTKIQAAETSAHSIGTTVIGVVAGLAVVGIVIALVRKL